MIISDLSCLEVFSASDDVVGGQFFGSFTQFNGSTVSQSISNSGTNSGFIFNQNATTQDNTSGEIIIEVTTAA